MPRVTRILLEKPPNAEGENKQLDRGVEGYKKVVCNPDKSG